MTRKRNAGSGTPKEPTPDLLPIQKILLAELRRTMRLNTETGPQEITIEKALILQLIQTAVKKASPHALGQVMRYSQRAQKQEAKRIFEEIARGKEYQLWAEQGLQTWKDAGKDPTKFVPHPDDIVVTEGVGWKMIGPIDQEDLADVLKRRAERNALIGQATLEERLATKQEWRQAGDDAQKQPGALAWFMVHLIDSTLPKRFRLTMPDLMQFDRIHNGMTKRELLKHMHGLWRSIGKRVARGKHLPALNEMMPMIHAVCGAANLMHTREKAGKPMELREIAHELEARWS